MKPILLAATLIFAATAKLHATEALIFDGGGYNIYILIGITDQPIVAQVRFTAPGAKEWVDLPRNLLRIKKFDFEKRVLVMHFSNQKTDPDLPRSFSLSAKKANAVLSINGKQIKSTFNWDI